MGNFININDNFILKKDSILSVQMMNLSLPCYVPFNSEAERGRTLLKDVNKRREKLESLCRKLEKNKQKRSLFSKEKENSKIEFEIGQLRRTIPLDEERAQKLLATPNPPCEYEPDLGMKAPYIAPRTTRSFEYSTYSLLLIEYSSNQECKKVFVTDNPNLIQHINNAELAYNSFCGMYADYYTTNFGEWDKSSYEDAAIKFYLNMPQGSYLYSDQPVQEILTQVSES